MIATTQTQFIGLLICLPLIMLQVALLIWIINDYAENGPWDSDYDRRRRENRAERRNR